MAVEVQVLPAQSYLFLCMLGVASWPHCTPVSGVFTCFSSTSFPVQCFASPSVLSASGMGKG